MIEPTDSPDALEAALRGVLAAQDPGERFTARVLARLPDPAAAPRAQPTPHKQETVRRPARNRWSLWLPVGLAASLALAVAMHFQQIQQRDTAAGLRAKEQLLVALRLTSEQLDVAQRVVAGQAW